MEMTTRPSTYFIQEAMERGLKAIKARLDPDMDNRPFFWLNLSPELKLEHSIWDLGDMCARYVDSYMLARQATGYEDDIDEENSLRKMLSTCDPYAHPFMATRMLIAYVDEYLQDQSDENKKKVDDLVSLIRSKMTFCDDYAYYFRQAEGWRSMDQPLGDFMPYPTYAIGGIILALSRYLESAQSPNCEDLIKRLCKFVINISGTFEEDGRYKGHTHSGGILTAIAGILRWAILIDDKQTIELMKNAFDWTLKHSSSWGWVPDGLEENPNSGETCSLTDAIHAGILLGRYVDSSYFDVVERFARNQLLENQFLDPERAMPKGEFPQNDAVKRALYGSWASWSKPNSLDNCLKGVEGCCLGAGIRACYLVWNSIVEKREDRVFVNLAISRNSEWVEIVSYQPYQGRIDILIHDAPNLCVKIPSWVSLKDINTSVDGVQIPFNIFCKNYVEINGMIKGQVLRIEYPLRKTEITEIISNQEYKVTWKGDSVISITPVGEIYPTFERQWMEGNEMPIISNQPYKNQKYAKICW